MAIKICVTGITGTCKKIAAQDVIRTMGADGAWFSSKAVTVSVNDYLTIADEDYLIVEAGESVDLKFEADSSGSDGQGTSIPNGLSEVNVQSVNGTCKGLRASNSTQATTKADAYKDVSAFTLKVNDTLAPSDMAVCDKTGTFTLRFIAYKGAGAYTAIPAVRMYNDKY